jgi:formate dehydrogenase maturation protein FdhE
MGAARVAALLAGVLLVSFHPAAAQEQPSRMVELLEATGIKPQLEQQWQTRRQMVRSQLTQMLAGVRSQFPAIPQDVASELDRMSRELLESVANPYTVDEVLRVYAEPFDRNYPGPALARATQQMSTPDGQLMMRTITEAVSALNQFVATREQEVVNRATANFLVQLKTLPQRIPKP